MPKILAFAGSARKESFNKLLVKIAAGAARNAGAEVTLVDLADYPMPIFDQDLEQQQGLPENAKAIKRLLVEHDGFLIASPEYNSAFSPLLKNVLDWASRSEPEDSTPLAAYKGKAAAIMATSPGQLGGLRGLVFLRMLLNNLGVLVIPQQKAIASAAKAFDEHGQLLNPSDQNAIQALATDLVETLRKLGA